MNRSTLTALTLALVTAAALPLEPALAGDRGYGQASHNHYGGRDRGHHQGNRDRGGGHHHAGRGRGHDRHHHGYGKHHGHHDHGHRHHGHHHHGHWYGRSWRCGNSLGFAYDSWSDSFRLGGLACF